MILVKVAQLDFLGGIPKKIPSVGRSAWLLTSQLMFNKRSILITLTNAFVFLWVLFFGFFVIFFKIRFLIIVARTRKTENEVAEWARQWIFSNFLYFIFFNAFEADRRREKPHLGYTNLRNVQVGGRRTLHLYLTGSWTNSSLGLQWKYSWNIQNSQSEIKQNSFFLQIFSGLKAQRWLPCYRKKKKKKKKKKNERKKKKLVRRKIFNWW